MKLLLVRMGSHLYGNNHSESDKDFLCVTSEPHSSRIHKKTRIVKHMAHRYDMTEMDLSTFSRFGYDGIPQVLEALFSNKDKILIDRITEYRSNFYASIPNMRDKYMGVIGNMSRETCTPKQKFHALRLAYNFNEAETTGGRFQPTLSIDNIKLFTKYSREDYIDYCMYLNKLSTLEIN